jgi:hypothetical protein
VKIRLPSAFLIAVAISAPALFLLRTASPEPIHPLGDLSGSADLIVLADVEHVSEAARTEPRDGAMMPPGTDRVAHLKVREIWKGPGLDSVDVPFNDFGRWPAPPGYVEGETVVAFLRHDGREWTTVGMSQGAIAARGRLQDLREEVGGVVALQGRSPSRGDLPRIPVAGTVGQGGESLPHDGILPVVVPHGATHGGVGGPRKAAAEALAKSFVRRGAADEELPEILELLADYPDPGVDCAAIEKFESVIEQPSPPAWTRDVLPLLLERLGDPDPDSRLSGLEKVVTSEDLERMRLIWREARRDLVDEPEHDAAEGTVPLCE